MRRKGSPDGSGSPAPAGSAQDRTLATPARSGTQRTCLTNEVGVDSLALLRDLQEHRVDQLIVEQTGLEPEVEELRVLGVVVVLFLLDARVGQVIDRDLEADAGAPAVCTRWASSSDRELLGELVVDPALAGLGRVSGRPARCSGPCRGCRCSRASGRPCRRRSADARPPPRRRTGSATVPKTSS